MNKKDYQETSKMMKLLSKKRPDISRKKLTMEDMFGWGTTIRGKIAEFRNKSKTLYKVMGFYFVVRSAINPNGITGLDDMGRTRTIEIKINGQFRGYCEKTRQNIGNYEYKYFRSYNQFKEWFVGEDISDETMIEVIRSTGK